MTTSEDLLAAKLKRRPFEEVRSAMFRRPPSTESGLVILAQSGWTKEEFNSAFVLAVTNSWSTFQMTTSEDLLVAKLKRWSYDELLAAVIATANAADCTNGIVADLFAKAGWTYGEYLIKCRRTQKLRSIQKKIK